MQALQQSLSTGIAQGITQLGRNLRPVFVYGTLKRGRPNHYKMEGTHFVGEAVTTKPLPLVVGGERFVPYLLNMPGLGKRIRGEVYFVTDEQMEEMDRFEGAPTYYHRQRIDLQPLSPYVPSFGEVYFKTDVQPELLGLPMMDNYNDNRYVPRANRR